MSEPLVQREPVRARGRGRGRGIDNSRAKIEKKITWTNDERRVLINALVDNAAAYKRGDNPVFYSGVFNSCTAAYPGWTKDRNAISNKVRLLKRQFNSV